MALFTCWPICTVGKHIGLAWNPKLNPNWTTLVVPEVKWTGKPMEWSWRFMQDLYFRWAQTKMVSFSFHFCEDTANMRKRRARWIVWLTGPSSNPVVLLQLCLSWDFMFQSPLKLNQLHCYDFLEVADEGPLKNCNSQNDYKISSRCICWYSSHSLRRVYWVEGQCHT